MEGMHRGTVFAKIQWKDKEYYVRQKRITIGRHSSRGEVDIDLGDSQFISRVHLEILYEQPDFFLRCNGKNGVFVDNKFWRPRDGQQCLPSKCLIWFPSTGMFLLFSSLVEEPAANKRCLSPPSGSAGLAPSPATTDSSQSASPVSVEVACISDTGDTSASEAIVGTSGCAGPQGSGPLLLHSYSTQSEEQQQVLVLDIGAENDGEQERAAKPPFSYAQLIVQAVSSAWDKQLTLSGIYSYITRHYPYYRTADKGWQNSIRHNLSMNRCFMKVARTQEQSGKGCYWRVHPQSEARLIEQAFRSRQRGRRGRTGAGDKSRDSPDWVGDGAAPPNLQSEESPSVPVVWRVEEESPNETHLVGGGSLAQLDSSNSGMTTVMVAGGKTGDATRTRLEPLADVSANAVMPSPEPEDIIVPANTIYLTDECVMSIEPSESTIASASPSAGSPGDGTSVGQRQPQASAGLL